MHAALDAGEQPVDIHGSAMLDFGSGRTAVLGFGFDNMYRNVYEIWGTTGVLKLERAFSIPPTLEATLTIARQDGVETRSLPPRDQFAAQVDACCAGVWDAETVTGWRDDARGQAAAMEAMRGPR